MKALALLLWSAAFGSFAVGPPALAEEDPALDLQGKQSSDFSDRVRGDRVVGGMDAPLNAYPFYVELRRFTDDNRYSLCGAAVIAPNWLLTAAHCVQSRDKTTGRASSVSKAKSFRALPGGGIRQNAPGIEVTRVVPHPQYSADYALQNDIALIKLAAAVSPPYLPLAQVEPAPGTPVRIVGYGLTSYEGESSQRLREADTRLISRRDCSIVSTKLKSAGPIDRLRICADVEGLTGLVDSCQGDSGGPLLAADEQGFWQTVGVVSYGYKCAVPGFPGVYTNVAAYRGWINQVISGEGGTDDQSKPSDPVLRPPPVDHLPVSAPTALTQLANLVDYGGVTVALATRNTARIAAGATVGFAINSQLEGDLYVFDIGRDGDARQIFPNERTRKGRVKTKIARNRSRILPSSRDGFRLRAQERAGERWIVAIVVDGLQNSPKSAEVIANMTTVAATRGLEPVPDPGEYLREVVAALKKSCVTDQVSCAFGSIRISIGR